MSDIDKSLATLKGDAEGLEHDPEYQSEFLSACFVAQVTGIMADKNISVGDMAARLELGVDDVENILNECTPEQPDLFTICAFACALDSEVTITITPRKR